MRLLAFRKRLKGTEDGKGRRAGQWVMVGSVVLSIAAMGYYGYGKDYGKYGENFRTFDEVRDLLPGKTDTAMKTVTSPEEEFTRFTGPNLSSNTTLYSNLHNTQFYWSISNRAISDFMDELAVNEPVLWMYTGLDDRTVLAELACCGYYICQETEETWVPYGFEKIAEEGGYQIYRNQYALPLGYTYENARTEEETAGLDELRLQEAMLQSAILEELPQGWENTSAGKPLSEASETLDVPYQVTAGEGVTYLEDGFEVTGENAAVTLTFDGAENSETYLRITGLHYTGVKHYRMNFGVSSLDTAGNMVNKKITYFTNRHKRYAGKTDFVVNLCYSKEKKQQITLTFTDKGTYRFDSLSVICQKMDGYEERVKAMTQNVLEDVVMEPNCVKGSIHLEKRKLLCLSIPYDKGWKALVDGKESPLYRTNKMYLSLNLEPGEHEIELIYHTPYLAAGCGITVAGLLICLLLEMGYISAGKPRHKKRIMKKERE